MFGGFLPPGPGSLVPFGPAVFANRSRASHRLPELPRGLPGFRIFLRARALIASRNTSAEKSKKSIWISFC